MGFVELYYMIGFVLCVCLVGVIGFGIYIRPTRQFVYELLRIIPPEDYIKNVPLTEVLNELENLAREKTRNLDYRKRVKEVRNDYEVYFEKRMKMGYATHYIIEIYPRGLGKKVWVHYDTYNRFDYRLESNCDSNEAENELIASETCRKPWEMGIILRPGNNYAVIKMRREYSERLLRAVV